MTTLITIFTGAALAFSVFALIFTIRRRGTRARIKAAFELLAATLQMENAHIQQLPTVTLNGTYRTYPMLIECPVRRDGAKRVGRWRITTELSRLLDKRLYVQGEAHEAIMRKFADLHVVTTGNKDFDKRMSVFCSDREFAKKVFNPYLRQRFMWAGFTNFTMEIKENISIMEIVLNLDVNVRYVRHALEAWTEFLNILESV